MARKRTRSGRITLRTSPEVHEQLAEVGSLIHLDINGILNYMLHRYLGPLAAELTMFKEYRDQAREQELQMWRAWRRRHPDKTPRDFLEEFRKFVFDEPNSLEPLQ
jgi:hypothetical protein